MSDCILCGHDSGGSEYDICGECCESNAASERELVKACVGCYLNCDCAAIYIGEQCPCCCVIETEKRSGPQLIDYGFVALFSFAAGVVCGWLLL